VLDFYMDQVALVKKRQEVTQKTRGMKNRVEGEEQFKVVAKHPECKKSWLVRYWILAKWILRQMRNRIA